MKNKKLMLCMLGAMSISFTVGATTVKYVTVILKDQKMTIQGVKSTEQVLNYDGSTYVPLRRFGEMLGEEIDYKDGEIYIGDQPSSGASTSYYSLYCRHHDTWEIVEVGGIRIENSLSMKEKLTLLAKGLSEKEFSGLPIEVEQVYKIGGKDIAVIHLKDGNDKTWATDYFQGSVGGSVTKTAIEETFLQRSIDEEWIDGIKIRYNGGDVDEEHIQMNKIIYR